MTDNRATAEIIIGNFAPPLSERERELVQRITLLQNYAVELQETVERLERQLDKAFDTIETLKSKL
jgi:hypothetical protein